MKRILVVDDHEDIVLLTQEILSTKDYEVEITMDGKDCLKKVEDFKPDLLLLDLMIPEMSGWQVLKELETRGLMEGMKVALFTVKSRYEPDMKKALAGERFYFIHKPVTFESLLDEVNQIFQE